MITASRNAPRTRTLAATLSLALLSTLNVACGNSSTSPNPGNTGGNSFNAKINGAGWSASSASLTIGAVRAAPGLYSLTGTGVGSSYTMIFALYNIGGVGSFPLGVSPQIFGGNVTLSNTLGGWSTPLNGVAGQVNITTLTATRIAGTFSYNAAPQTGTNGTLAVTDGIFDVPVTGASTIGALPDNAGSRVTGAIGGTTFAAATVASTLTTGTSGRLTVAASNGERNLGISLESVSAAGTYLLNATTPARSIQVTGAPGSATATWSSQISGGSGSVVITSITSARVVGTYSATLLPATSSATGSLLVNGSFDLGRQ